MKKLLIFAVCFFCVLAVAGPAKAVTITLNDVIGTVVPGSPADPDDERDRLNVLIGMYNTSAATPVTVGDYTYVLNAGSNVPDAPLPAAVGGVQVQADDDDITSFDLGTGYLYLMAKFGNKDAIYWLGGQTGFISLPIASPFPAQGGGLSHITLFNPVDVPPPGQVPEPATLLLLGLGLVGLAGLRKKS